MNLVDGDTAWRRRIQTILEHGHAVSPRKQPTTEILFEAPLTLDMARPVVTTPERKLNYRFMCAEALWILSGDNKLAPLTRFVKRMAEFSDDGETLFGAYGPPITDQLPYILEALLRDRDTRQAVLTIWRQNPPRSKDIPCTVAMSFIIREGLLHQHVFMRSSDIWLGVPYDMFSFACIGLWVVCHYNATLVTGDEAILPGALSISMVSSHLYERNRKAAEEVLMSTTSTPIQPVPEREVREGNWQALELDLITQRDLTAVEPRYWRVRP